MSFLALKTAKASMQQNHIAREVHDWPKAWPADRECLHRVFPCACQACELNISSTLYNLHDKRPEPSEQWDYGCCSRWLSNYVPLNRVSARSRFHEAINQKPVVNSLNLSMSMFCHKDWKVLKTFVLFLRWDSWTITLTLLTHVIIVFGWQFFVGFSFF